MKRLFLVLLLPLLVISCNQEELKKLREENLRLKNEQVQNEEAIYNFAQAYNSIQSNLDSIMAKEGIIHKIATTGEKSKSSHEIINEQINTIYDLLLQNRKELEKLRKQAGQLSRKNKDLEQIIERLNRSLEEKVVEIELLRGQLVAMQYQITGLNQKVDSLSVVSSKQKEIIETQQATIQSQETELNTVYFAIGTEKELQANRVISKEGGFIGIGKSQKVSNDLNIEYFQKADKRTMRTIPIGAHKVRIVTQHPTDSYTLHGEKTVDSLTITNPERFWKNSSFLVISIKR